LHAHFSTIEDPDGKSVFVKFRELGTDVTSFVLLAPPFFRELEKLREAGVVAEVLVGSADVTFGVERQGCAFNEFFFQMYREIQGRWRKTSWSAALMCPPRENRRVQAIFPASERRAPASKASKAQANACGLFPRVVADFRRMQ
jgi:hypothetical protein